MKYDEQVANLVCEIVQAIRRRNYGDAEEVAGKLLEEQVKARDAEEVRHEG